MASMRALIKRSLSGYKQGENHVYLAYLPLARIFELGAEIIMMSFGIPVAYSSIMTVSDESAGIRKAPRLS
jgi:long-subunit acyl-CoA synthetase (AMP-forming)